MNVFSVSQFIDFVNAAFSAAVFPEGVAVEGEIVEYRVSQGKWIWFDLKDDRSIVSCFATVWQLRTPLEDGMQVRVFGLPRVYPKSGKFSIGVERVELVGEGALRRAFELLKKKLAAEGLFSPERKRPLPRFPRQIGLIASSGSAAYGDFLRVLGNRWGGLAVRLIDVAVQGRDAPRQIAAAFRYLNSRPESADVVVLTRGGGSLEDLQAFNSEEVARAVFGSRIPVIVGVGHERDETLADLAADVRASTPTNAAEIVVPDRQEIAVAVDAGVRRMLAVIRSGLIVHASAVGRMADSIEAGIRRAFAAFNDRIRDLDKQFGIFAARTSAAEAALSGLSSRLFSAAGHMTGRLAGQLAVKERLLAGLDPRRLLSRGYALVRRKGKIVKDAAQVDIGERLDIQLAKGVLAAEVAEKIIHSDDRSYGQKSEKKRGQS